VSRWRAGTAALAALASMASALALGADPPKALVIQTPPQMVLGEQEKVQLELKLGGALT